MTGSWTVQVETGTHAIRADLSPLTGQLKVYFDGNLIEARTVWWMLGDIHAFERVGHSFALRVEGPSYLGGHLALRVDGTPVEQGGVPAAVRGQAPPAIQFIEDTNVSETSEVIGIEDYPLDNRFGNSPFSTDRQVSKETTNELSVGSSNQLSGSLNLDVLAALKAEVTAQVSRQTGYKVGERVAESQTLHFTVGPHSAVVYRAIWKRKVRTGEYRYVAEGEVVTVPYRLSYGLTCEVQTQELKT